MGKKKQPAAVININQLNLEIDYDKLAEAIVKAHNRIDTEKKRQEERSQDEFRTKMGFKDYTQEQNSVKRILKTAVNRLHMVFRVLFISKKDVQGIDPALAFVQTLAKFVLGFAQFGCYGFCVLVIAPIIYHPETEALSVGNGVLFALLFMASFLLAQIFRMIRLQVESMRDREYLFAIIGAIVSIASILMSFVGLSR